MGHYDTCRDRNGLATVSTYCTAAPVSDMRSVNSHWSVECYIGGEVHIPFCSLVSVVCEGVREEEWSVSSSSKDWNVEKVGEPRGWRPGEGGGWWTHVYLLQGIISYEVEL